MTPNFIDIYENVLEPDVCKDIIRRFEEDKENHFQGVVADPDGNAYVHKDQKVCTELMLSGLPHWADIDKLVFEAVSDGIKKTNEVHTGFQTLNGKVCDEGYRIKRYMPGGHEFFDLHIDAGGFPQAHRQLVLFMYLNTVEEGGETEFPEHGVKVKPVEGRMVTFPPFWTHAHIAHPPYSGPKYAISAWMTFIRK